MCDTVGICASGVPVGEIWDSAGVFFDVLSGVVVELKIDVGSDEFSEVCMTEDCATSVVGSEVTEDAEESVAAVVEITFVGVSRVSVVDSGRGSPVMLVGASPDGLLVVRAVDDSKSNVLVAVAVESNGVVIVSTVVVDSSFSVLVGSEVVSCGVLLAVEPLLDPVFKVLVIGGKTSSG